LTEWLTDPAKKIDVARRAIDYIESHRGAAARTADLLVALPQPTRPE
jgi:hypothetical protein